MVLCCGSLLLVALHIPISTQAGSGLSVRQVEVLDAPSAEEVERYTHRQAVPVVLRGTGVTDGTGWSTETLLSLCGSQPVTGTYCVDTTVAMQLQKSGQRSRMSQQWGGLGPVSRKDLDRLRIRTFADVLHHQRKGKGNQWYVHDVSIANLCPSLGKRLRVPSYFPVEGDKMFNIHERCPSSHPSIFVGMNGTRTLLHIDTENTRFW